MYDVRTNRWGFALGAILAILAVAGCRLDEQERQTQFEKGTYLGEADQQLTDEQLGELRGRARYQN